MVEAVKFASVPKMEKLESEITRLKAKLAEARELLTIIADEDGWVIGAEMAGKIRAFIDGKENDDPTLMEFSFSLYGDRPLYTDEEK
jgi:hypothetical protein